ncbi:hypothetical protein GCM10023074_31470 [Microbispora amethystogenes]|uniref:Uncharacterized protein n=1 Tax=Microbispora amethystogenes TaxID=1427754 RepID=A0ABQ4FF33_9ACTN|nr:hypothetical protein Mam01_35900 [Microbispora amethystogenes]
MGALIAAAAAASGQVSGAFAALGLGVAAPLVVEKLTRLVPAPQSNGTDPQSLIPHPGNRAQVPPGNRAQEGAQFDAS